MVFGDGTASLRSDLASARSRVAFLFARWHIRAAARPGRGEDGGSKSILLFSWREGRRSGDVAIVWGDLDKAVLSFVIDVRLLIIDRDLIRNDRRKGVLVWMTIAIIIYYTVSFPHL